MILYQRKVKQSEVDRVDINLILRLGGSKKKKDRGVSCEGKPGNSKKESVGGGKTGGGKALTVFFFAARA